MRGNKIKLNTIFLLLLASCLCGAGEITLSFFDTGGYSSTTPAVKKESVTKQLSKTGARIIVLAGIKNKESLNEIASSLGKEFSEIVESEDKESHIAVISDMKPEKFESITDKSYKINDRELKVLRGFLHCTFHLDGYTLHVLGADLKDRRKDPEFNQTDMRRFEARQLRYLANEILKKEPEANIIILGNFNDTCGMSPVKEIYNRRLGFERKLYDIRPVDSLNTTWTFWDRENDDYERIDYALASYGLIPEIVRGKTSVVHEPCWTKGSLHRPIVVTITTAESEKWAKEKLDAIYPYCIYSEAAAHFEKDKPIGEKHQRNDPVSLESE